MIYNPVKFILSNNPWGFHLACSDTVLTKEKAKHLCIIPCSVTLVLHYGITTRTHLHWGTRASNPIRAPLGEHGSHPRCDRAAQSHPWPLLPQLGSSLWLWEAEGQGWSVTLGRQVLLCLSEQGPAGLHCGQQSHKNTFIQLHGGRISFNLWLFIRILWILALQSVGQIWAAVIACWGH